MFNLFVAASIVMGAGAAGAVTVPPEAPEAADEYVADLTLVELPVVVELPPPEEAVAEEAPTDTPPEEADATEEERGDSAHGKAVSAIARDDSLHGCEKGQAVAAVASSKSQGHRNDGTGHPDPCSAGDHANRGGPSAFVQNGADDSSDENDGQSSGGGPPDHAGPPDNAGPPDHAGPPGSAR